jgi:hypothetical protein
MAAERTQEQQDMLDKMDAAAAEAKKIFDGILTNKVSTPRDVVAWWQAWYPKAGHKRLGRILAQAK